MCECVCVRVCVFVCVGWGEKVEAFYLHGQSNTLQLFHAATHIYKYQFMA